MPRSAPQVDRVVTILNLLAARPDGGSLTELARELHESPSTMVHVLAALTSAGYLIREPADRRYHLGPALVEPGRVAADRYPALAIARRLMTGLTSTFEAPCFAFVRDRRWARLVHYTWHPSHPASPMQIGELVPVVPPLGAVFIAWAPEDQIDAWLGADASLPESTSSELRAALATVRRLGFVVEGQPDDGLGTTVLATLQAPPSPSRDRTLRRMLADHDRHLVTDIDARSSYTATGVGAPVFGPDGAIELSITLGTFDRTLSGDALLEIGRAVQTAAATASQALQGMATGPLPHT